MADDSVILDESEASVAKTVTGNAGVDEEGSSSSDSDDSEEYRPKSG